jgi:anthraniloyl-CoA monooxygenase
MRVVVVGGGPAGLYTALLLKKDRAEIEVIVLERNAPDVTFGWGVVFSDQTLENFRQADEPTFRAITANFAHWDDIDVVARGRRITSGGHGFSGIARRKLLSILQERARELGVEIRFHTEVQTLDGLGPLGLADADVIVAADGVNSAIRAELAEAFQPDLDLRDARFVWLGTTMPLDAFTFYIVENEHGVFQAHCYRFDESTSTFIVECDEDSWRAAGLDTLDAEGTIAACERLFAEWLGPHRLMSNAAHRAASPWTRFTRVKNARWFHDRVVLVGDAAHTAHFSIGSGTKLAMEDAIALARALAAVRDAAGVSDAFRRYEEARMTESLRLQNAARNSMEWFEHVKRYARLPAEQLAYSLLTRSQRVSHENLRLRDAAYVAGVERWFASDASAAHHVGRDGSAPPPPMFTPFRLRELTLANRVVLAPMDMYSARNGTPNDFHLVHLGARALGGAGLVMTEMVCVSAEGRITLGCTGMYAPEHQAHWRRVVDFVHGWSDAKICLQLGHSGRKGATRLPWEGPDLPLEEEGWTTMGPSGIPYAIGLPAPREMTRVDMDRVRNEFVHAARMAVEAGFDMLELHAAHGYLISSFLTPVSNQRDDEYGGSLENRMRFPLEVFRSMREIWPNERPMSVRVSATDWTDDGLTDDDAVAIGRAFMYEGADIIHVSTGQTTTAATPVYGRLFQTPYSDRIRNEARVPTIAVGNVTEADQVNGIIAAGRADLVALGRPHLSDPHWTLHAAASLGYAGQPWPRQYHLGRLQHERELARARDVAQPGRG